MQRLNEVSQSKSKVKFVLFAFFDVGSIVHKFLPKSQTIDQQVYKEILPCILRTACEMRRELLQNKVWLLYLTNASTHNTLCS